MTEDSKKLPPAHKIDVASCQKEYRFWIYFFLIEDCDLLEKFEDAVVSTPDGLIDWEFWTQEKHETKQYKGALQKVGNLFRIPSDGNLPECDPTKWNRENTGELLKRAKLVTDDRRSYLKIYDAKIAENNKKKEKRKMQRFAWQMKGKNMSEEEKKNMEEMERKWQVEEKQEEIDSIKFNDHFNVIQKWGYIIKMVKTYLYDILKESEKLEKATKMRRICQETVKVCYSSESMSCDEAESSYCDICDCVHMDV